MHIVILYTSYQLSKLMIRVRVSCLGKCVWLGLEKEK